MITVNNCISRLRVDVKDMSLVNEEDRGAGEYEVMSHRNSHSK